MSNFEIKNILTCTCLFWGLVDCFLFKTNVHNISNIGYKAKTHERETTWRTTIEKTSRSSKLLK